MNAPEFCPACSCPMSRIDTETCQNCDYRTTWTASELRAYVALLTEGLAKAETKLLETLDTLDPIKPNMHHSRPADPAPAPQAAPAVQLATVEHYRLLNLLDGEIDPELP
jgi:hypothetical protein